jgi:hypothetical protein
LKRKDTEELGEEDGRRSEQCMRETGAPARGAMGGYELVHSDDVPARLEVDLGARKKRRRERATAGRRRAPPPRPTSSWHPSDLRRRARAASAAVEDAGAVVEEASVVGPLRWGKARSSPRMRDERVVRA